MKRGEVEIEVVDGKEFVVGGHEHTYDCLQFSARRQEGAWAAYCIADRVFVPDWTNFKKDQS